MNLPVVLSVVPTDTHTAEKLYADCLSILLRTFAQVSYERADGSVVLVDRVESSGNGTLLMRGAVDCEQIEEAIPVSTKVCVEPPDMRRAQEPNYTQLSFEDVHPELFTEPVVFGYVL